MNLKGIPLIIVYLGVLCAVYLIFGAYQFVFLFAGIILVTLGILNYFFRNSNKLTSYITSFIIDSKSISSGLILCGMVLLLISIF